MASESGAASQSKGQRGQSKALERAAIGGESPVDEDGAARLATSTAGHANPAGRWGVHPPRLNTLDDR